MSEVVGNGAVVNHPVTNDGNLEWAFFDILPKPVRLALIEADYEYSIITVYEAFAEAKKDLVEQVGSYATDWMAWQQILQMLDYNDRDTRKWERQMYENLVVEFAAEKRDRIEQAFQRAS